ncbi:hypothetical protein KDH02_004724 [Salmonella enterica]|nr:hypothetical protein [Salmonella enterica]
MNNKPFFATRINGVNMNMRNLLRALIFICTINASFNSYGDWSTNTIINRPPETYLRDMGSEDPYYQVYCTVSGVCEEYLGPPVEDGDIITFELDPIFNHLQPTGLSLRHSYNGSTSIDDVKINMGARGWVLTGTLKRVSIYEKNPIMFFVPFQAGLPVPEHLLRQYEHIFRLQESREWVPDSYFATISTHVKNKHSQSTRKEYACTTRHAITALSPCKFFAFVKGSIEVPQSIEILGPVNSVVSKPLVITVNQNNDFIAPIVEYQLLKNNQFTGTVTMSKKENFPPLIQNYDGWTQKHEYVVSVKGHTGWSGSIGVVNITATWN